MTSSHIVAVTAPAFCKSSILRGELITRFPGSIFNPSENYYSEDGLIEFLSDADAAIVGRDPITERVVSALPKIKIIAKYGVGLDNIDSAALDKEGIILGWTAGINRRAVAEMTLCFMLGLMRNIFSAGFDLKTGVWKKDGGSQLTGKTVGIIGFGNVGLEVARLLRPFECTVLARDILDITQKAKENGVVVCGFKELIRRSDLVTLHVPLTPDTRNLISAEVLINMKPSAFLINTSRGEVVSLSALKSALINGVIAGAALDVFYPEPLGDLEFLALPNFLGTPHTGGNSIEAVEAMGRAAIKHLCDFFEG